MSQSLIERVGVLVPKVTEQDVKTELEKNGKLGLAYAVSRYLHAERSAKVNALAVELLTLTKGS